MSQSHAKNYVHLVFSTKDRYPFLTNEVRPEMHRYLCGILYDLESPVLEINSVKDHVHILTVLSKNYSASKIMQELKGSSSKWIKTKGGMLEKFAWQGGYGLFSLCPSVLGSARRYIQDQERHHKKKSFKEEYLEFLKLYEVEYDERYLWD